MQIDHDKNEPPVDRSPAPWRWVLPLIALAWCGYLYSFEVHWASIALGVMTGAGIVAWAIDITGNKTPASWRRNPPGSGGSRPE